MNRPISAIINLQALSKNLNNIRKISPRTKIWSVIKANGYGHSIYAVFKGLNRTDGFALIDIEDAIKLRTMGWNKPILLLEGFFNSYDLIEIDYYKLTIVIHNYWQLQELKKFNFRNKLNIYIKINCGMNRLGFDIKEINHILNEIKLIKKISVTSLMTHISHSILENTINQINKTKILEKRFNNKLCFYNSNCILLYPEIINSWIRPGIILYGASPSGISHDITRKGFIPTMTLQSRLIAIRVLNNSSYIGYDKIKINKKRIGIVACGYADGYPNNAPIGTPVFINGIKTEIVGSISMDTLIINLDHIPNNINIGCKVELWGNNLKIDDLAALIGTTSYKLMSSVNSRVKREFS